MPFSGAPAMKLSKEKRQQLILTALGTVAAVAGIGLGLIRFQKATLVSLGERKHAAAQKLELVNQTIEKARKLDSQLCDSAKHLEKLEEGMANGDLYAWVINTIRQFKLGYKVEIPQFSQIDGPKDVLLMPRFPYQQATLTVAGTAYFHDLGKFISDFENQFPYMRISNLTLEPGTSLASNGDKEKLSFRMEIITLVKPASA
jgi:hypothetical protein